MHHLCQCDPCLCGGDTTTHSQTVGLSIEAAALDARHRGPRGRLARHLGRRPGGKCPHAPAVSDPPIGAHLVTPRRGYSHHGIYAGNGTVLHYAGLSRRIRRGPVEAVTLSAFAHSKPVHVACRSVQALDTQDILERARSRLGENRYHLLTNNCEHFAMWSRYGESRSAQVERWLDPPALVLRGLVSLVRGSVSVFKVNETANATA